MQRLLDVYNTFMQQQHPKFSLTVSIDSVTRNQILQDSHTMLGGLLQNSHDYDPSVHKKFM